MFSRLKESASRGLGLFYTLLHFHAYFINAGLLC